MTAKNDITGDAIKTKPSTSYADNYDAIFRQPINLNTYPKHDTLCQLCGEVKCDCSK